MTEAALIITIVSLLTYIGVREYFDRKDQKDIRRMLMSKSVDEVARAEVMEKIEPNEEPEEKHDMVEVRELSDDDFDKFIKEQNKVDKDL